MNGTTRRHQHTSHSDRPARQRRTYPDACPACDERLPLASCLCKARCGDRQCTGRTR